MLAISQVTPSSFAAFAFMTTPVPDITYLASARREPVDHPPLRLTPSERMGLTWTCWLPTDPLELYPPFKPIWLFDCLLMII